MSPAAAKRRRNGTAKHVVRVAVYTRKSVTEGLDQEFNSLDAQREAIEAYVTSQKADGWVALPEKYDDGGFTGANVERPAFQRLLWDIEAGKVDVVAVHRIDRLSRSLLDFTRLMEMFRRHEVTFVSVTQQFSTTTSVGRMTLNLLATFAEFEREVISERTKEKMLATRRRGAWTGGRPVLGYDVVEKKLVINDEEAERVRAIFALYQAKGSLLAVTQELARRGWETKTWTNKKGVLVEGTPYTRTTVHFLLKNALYAGWVRAGDDLVEGEHEAIVDREEWDLVQAKLAKNAGLKHRRPQLGGRSGTVLLGGLLRCGRCGKTMGHRYTRSKRAGREHRYYVCATVQKHGAEACPGSRVTAGKLETFVLDHLRGIGRDPGLIEATLTAAAKERTWQKRELNDRLEDIAKDRAKLGRERAKLVEAIGDGRPSVLERLDAVDAGVARLDKEAAEIRLELSALGIATVDPDELRAVLAKLEPLWAELFPVERTRLFGLLLERVEFDPDGGEVAITFRPGGPETLRGEL